MAITIMRGKKKTKVKKTVTPKVTKPVINPSDYPPLTALKTKRISLFNKLNMLITSVIASNNTQEDAKMVRYMSGLTQPSDYDGVGKDLEHLQEVFKEYVDSGDSTPLVGILAATEAYKV